MRLRYRPLRSAAEPSEWGYVLSARRSVLREWFGSSEPPASVTLESCFSPWPGAASEMDPNKQCSPVQLMAPRGSTLAREITPEAFRKQVAQTNPWFEKVGVCWVRVPRAVAIRLPYDVATPSSRNAVADRHQLHRVFASGLMDPSQQVPDEWVKKLAAIDILAETALRALELRLAERELDHLRSATHSSNLSSIAALLVALASVVVSAIALLGWGRDAGVQVTKPVEVRQTTSASKIEDRPTSTEASEAPVVSSPGRSGAQSG